MPTNKGTFNEDELSEEILLLFNPIINLYRQNLEILIQPYDLSAGQPPLINLLIENDGIPQKDLADRLNVKPASVTMMLDRMEKWNIIERKKDPYDMRVTRVYLTPKGRKSGKKMSSIINFINGRTLAGFRTEEKILLLRLLEQMKRNLEAERSELELLKNIKP